MSEFFKSIFSTGTTNKQAKALLSFGGAFGTFSSKLAIAEACRLLPSNLIRAINHLRKARNEIAHKMTPYKMTIVSKEISGCFNELGPNFNNSLSQLSTEVITSSFIKNCLEVKNPLDTSKNLFLNKDEILDYLSNSESVLDSLNKRHPLFHLGIGVASIYGMILLYQKSYINKFEIKNSFYKSAANHHKDKVGGGDQPPDDLEIPKNQ